MERVHDSARECKSKDAYATPCRGEFEATREAWIRWVSTGPRRMRSEVKLLAVHYISLYASRKIHNDERVLVAWPRLETLADELGITTSAADRRIKRLVKRGYLSRWTGDVPRGGRGEERRGRPSSAYRFTMPPAKYFSRSWQDKLTDIFSRLRPESGKNKEGIFSRLAAEFFPLNDSIFPARIEEMPVESGSAPDSMIKHTDIHIEKKASGLLDSVSGAPKDVGGKVASGAITTRAGKANAGRKTESSGATDSSPTGVGESESVADASDIKANGSGKPPLRAVAPPPVAEVPPPPVDAEVERLQAELARAEEGDNPFAILSAKQNLERHIESIAREARQREKHEKLYRFVAKLESGEIAASAPDTGDRIMMAISAANNLGDRNLIARLEGAFNKVEQAALFAYGDELNVSSSVIGKLLRALKGNAYQTRLKLESARGKQNPAAYINAIATRETQNPSKAWDRERRRPKTTAEQVII